jgi:hypothetical protein
MAKKGIRPRAHGCEGMRWDRVPLVLHFTGNKWSKCARRCKPKNVVDVSIYTGCCKSDTVKSANPETSSVLRYHLRIV